MSIQSSINSMIGSAGRAALGIRTVRELKNRNSNTGQSVPAQSVQAQAAQIALQHKEDAIQAKKDQKNRVPIYNAKGDIINGERKSNSNG